MHASALTSTTACATTVSLSLPAVSAGDVVVVQEVLNGGAICSDTESSPTAPAGYTQQAQVASGGAGATASLQTVWTHVWQTGDPTSSLTFAWTTNATYTFIVSTWSGANQTTPVDTYATNTNTASRNTSVTDTGLTLASTNDAVLAFGSDEIYYGVTIASATTGWTSQQSNIGAGNAPGDWLYTLNTVATPTGNFVATASTSIWWTAITLALAPAGSPPPPTTVPRHHGGTICCGLN